MLSFGLGVVRYQVLVAGGTHYSLLLNLREKEGKVVATGDRLIGELKVVDPKLWWPYLMHENPGYLYYLEVTCTHFSHFACLSFHCPIRFTKNLWV